MARLTGAIVGARRARAFAACAVAASLTAGAGDGAVFGADACRFIEAYDRRDDAPPFVDEAMAQIIGEGRSVARFDSLPDMTVTVLAVEHAEADVRDVLTFVAQFLEAATGLPFPIRQDTVPGLIDVLVLDEAAVDVMETGPLSDLVPETRVFFEGGAPCAHRVDPDPNGALRRAVIWVDGTVSAETMSDCLKALSLRAVGMRGPPSTDPTAMDDAFGRAAPLPGPIFRPYGWRDLLTTRVLYRVAQPDMPAGALRLALTSAMERDCG